MKYIYPIYLFFLLFLALLNVLTTKSHDLSRWLPCSIQNKTTVVVNGANINIYEIQDSDFHLIAELFHCIKRNPDNYDKMLMSCFPESKLIECFESAYCHDLKDSENSILMQNRKLIIYKTTNDSLLIHCKSYENLDVSEPFVIEATTPLTCSEKTIHHLNGYITILVVSFLITFPPINLIINKNPNFKKAIILIISYHLPFTIILFYLSGKEIIHFLIFIIGSNFIIAILYKLIRLTMSAFRYFFAFLSKSC